MADTSSQILLGRSFHGAESNYVLPNDTQEHTRLTLQHRMLRKAAGENYLAPIKEYEPGIKDILDICCGSGQWALEIAESFPQAQVIGIDISQPNLSKTSPENCKFITGDATAGLPFPENSFDFIQMRTTPSLPKRDDLIKEIHRVLRPGAFITFVEPHESFSPVLRARSPALIEVDRLLALSGHTPNAVEEEEANEMSNVKKSWSLAYLIEGMLKDATNTEGAKLFKSVDKVQFNIPIGPWPQDPRQKEIGEMMGQVQNDLVEGFRATFVSQGLIDNDGFDKLLVEVRREVADSSLELQVPYVYAWGRKTT